MYKCPVYYGTFDDNEDKPYVNFLENVVLIHTI